MEYPFKDLLPIDEVLEREGYYKDWTHIDANAFHQISELVKFIREKGYGADTREAIAQALERVYYDAMKSGNADMELSMARKHFKDLASRLDASDSELSSASSEVKGAKRGYRTLAESLQNLSADMLNPNLGKLTQNHMSDELLAQIAGDAAVNAVPADRSLTTEKFAEKSVTPDKTNFISVTKNLLDKSKAVMGYDFDADGNQIERDIYCIIPKIPVKPNATVYKNKNGALVEYNALGAKVIAYPNASGRAYTLSPETHFVDLSVSISNLPTAQLEYGSVATPFEEFKPLRLKQDIKMGLENFETSDVQNVSRVVKTDLLKGDQPEFEHGDIAPSLTKVSTTLTRVRSTEVPFTMKRGESIEVLDTEKYQMAIATEDNSTSYVNGWNSTIYTATRNINVAFMFGLKAGGNVDIDDLKENIRFNSVEAVAKISDLQDGSSKIKYVTLSGSNTNDGNSLTSGYATLQKALDENPTKIVIENGDYFQSATKSDIQDLTIMPLSPEGVPVRILGGVELKSPTAYNSIYYFDYSEQNTYYNNVFVSKTQQPIQDASRPMYYANLWEVGNDEDYNMKPVLTLSECENEVGTFYYDGAKIYLNPKNKDNTFVPVNRETGLNLSGDKITILPLIEARYFDRDPLNLDYIRKLSAMGVVGSHSARGDGFSLDNTSGTLDKCEARFNTNDGFNPHFSGKTTFIDCVGSDNGDDGISHHEVCVGTIIGGKYERNGSGGVTPANDAKVTITGAIIRENGIGISQNVNDNVETISRNNLITGNGIGIVSNSRGKFISIGDVVQDNDLDIQGVMESY